MRKYIIIATVILAVASLSLPELLGNPALQKQHAGQKKNNTPVNCGFCHGTSADQSNPQAMATKALVKKVKGQNLVQLKKLRTCLGAGCH